jgi:hypothetical protein
LGQERDNHTRNDEYPSSHPPYSVIRLLVSRFIHFALLKAFVCHDLMILGILNFNLTIAVNGLLRLQSSAYGLP